MRFPWLMHPPGGYGGQGVADTPGVVGKQRERRAAGGGWPAAGSKRPGRDVARPGRSRE